MKKTFRRIGAFLLMLCMLIPTLTGCAFSFRLHLQNEFDAFLDQMLVDLVSGAEFNYKLVFRNPKEYGLSYQNYAVLSEEILQEQSKTDIRMRKKALEAAIEQIEAISPIILKDSQKASYYMLLDYLDTELRYVDVVDHGSLVAPSGGFIANLGVNFYEYPFDTESDVENYLKFLANIPEALDIVIEHTKMQIEKGQYVLTKYVQDTNVTYLASYIDQNETPFLDGFEAKIKDSEFLSDAEKEEYISQNEDIFNETLVPAFQDMRSDLKKIDVGEAKALSETEEGKRYYEYLLECESGTRMTVEEMEKYLKQKLATYRGILNKYVKSGFNVYLHKVKVSSAEDAINQLRQKIKGNMPEFTDPGCTLTYLPATLSVEGMLAYYRIPQADNNTENIVRLNGVKLGEDVSLADLLVTVAHESYPGHLYQINYWRQNGIHALISWMGQKSVTEGWAEYISMEALGWLGATEDEAKYLRASWALDRIAVMLGDIQVNYYGKTGKELNTYLCANLGISGTGDHFSSLRDVLIADPCSYAAYAIGFLQIMDLQDDVADELKDAYDQKAFFEAFLMAGCCRFDNMEMLVYKRLSIDKD